MFDASSVSASAHRVMDDASSRFHFPVRRQPEPFEKEMEDLSYSHRDIESIVMEDEAFQVLKKSLRDRGCVTNAFLIQNVHLFVHHVKQVREQRAARRNSKTLITRVPRRASRTHEQLNFPTPPADFN